MSCNGEKLLCLRLTPDKIKEQIYLDGNLNFKKSTTPLTIGLETIK